MSRVTWIETRKCGLLGRIFRWLFVVFNLVMVVRLIGSFALGEWGFAEVESASVAIVSTASAGLLASVWLVGDVILGVCVLMTRGRKMMITEVLD